MGPDFDLVKCGSGRGVTGYGRGGADPIDIARPPGIGEDTG
jgi:hypothetical protein